MSNTNVEILLAGGAAALTVDVLVFPLDTLKTRIQAADYKQQFTNPSTGLVKKSILFRGLYQGIASVVLATIPASGVFFITYEATKNIFDGSSFQGSGKQAIPQPLVNCLASSTAELASCLILAPAEVLKQNTQMVIQPPSPKGPNSFAAVGNMFAGSATWKALHRFKNPTQFWRGYTALAARNLPFTAMQFPLFEHLKSLLYINKEKSGSLLETALITAASAATAGSVVAVATTPIDVIKTRIMLAASNNDAPSAKRSGLSIGREIWRTQGLKGLFGGGALRGIWTALGSGLYLASYETGRVWLAQQRDGNPRQDQEYHE
ncbi:MAG: hypothetical protein M1829_005961 [Trizodia sp. TS-e1964]|nr:MAG: hypothetical protein M1829_005961 [Trizodia sp. TS-e1964]